MKSYTLPLTHIHTRTGFLVFSKGCRSASQYPQDARQARESTKSAFNTLQSTAIGHTDNTGICVKVHDTVCRGYLELEQFPLKQRWTGMKIMTAYFKCVI